MLAGHVMRARRQVAIWRASQYALSAIDLDQVVAVRKAAGELSNLLSGRIERKPLPLKVMREAVPIHRHGFRNREERSRRGDRRRAMDIAVLRTSASFDVVAFDGQTSSAPDHARINPPSTTMVCPIT